MIQMSLIPVFDGASYSPELDATRLITQFTRVRALMLDGKWRTLSEIHREVGGSEAGISARLRDLRKARNGGWNVERIDWRWTLAVQDCEMTRAEESFLEEMAKDAIRATKNLRDLDGLGLVYLALAEKAYLAGKNSNENR